MGVFGDMVGWPPSSHDGLRLGWKWGEATQFKDVLIENFCEDNPLGNKAVFRANKVSLPFA